jgi:hypothetical protein
MAESLTFSQPWTAQADYSYFYDAGGRRRCYLAPERFYESDTDTAQLAQEPLRWSMVRGSNRDSTDTLYLP